MKTLRDFNVSGKRVLVRCDFNVPLDKKGKISDDFRIKQTLPTIKYLIDNNAKIVLMCHLGEPEGKVVEELRVNKIAERLAKLLKKEVKKINDCVGTAVEDAVSALQNKEILLLENLRFHKEETLQGASGQANAEFAKQLASFGDIYVNDAFGVCHRDNASITEVPKLLLNCAGFLLEKEISTLEKVITSPTKPMVAIIGGKKVETKSKFINNISKVADFVIVSGLIAKEVAEKGIKFNFPEKIVSPTGDLGALDINAESIKSICEKIVKAKTVLWNGPFGKFEEKKYAKGSLAIAKAIIKSKAFSVIGGGETVEFLNKQRMTNKFSWVSTGGGAMLAYLSGDELPGIEVLGK